MDGQRKIADSLEDGSAVGTTRGGARWMIHRTVFGGCCWSRGPKKGPAREGPNRTGPDRIEDRTGNREGKGTKRQKGRLAQKVEQNSKNSRTDQGPTAVFLPLPKPRVAFLAPSFFYTRWPLRSVQSPIVVPFAPSPPPLLRSRLGLAECPHLRATKRTHRGPGACQRENGKGRRH